jgi:hypothetical protein
MLNCKKATRLVSESQDRKLSVTERIPLKFHLLICSGCKNFSQQIPFLSQAMRAFAQWEGDDAAKK